MFTAHDSGSPASKGTGRGHGAHLRGRSWLCLIVTARLAMALFTVEASAATAGHPAATMIAGTDLDYAPWITVRSNDKKRARLEAMRYFLSPFDYEGKDHATVREPDPLIVMRARDAVGD